MTYDSIEVFGMSNWMNGVAIIEMGKTGEKRKLVSGKQDFSLPQTEMSSRNPSGDVK